MDKSPDAFRTISEVAEALDLPQHVLRFWETRFTQIKPLKRGGGRRFYRPTDIDLLKGIRQLLYEQGYTIKGAQRLLKENGNAFVIALGNGDVTAIEAITQKKLAEEQAENTPLPAKPQQPRGLFGFMKSDSDAEIGGSNIGSGKDSKTLLQEALFELIECKRVLDRAR
ncbi:MerR family transcriptional regulator [uncultured Bartonella sp.]|uniref:MerR family transcriptional regulator n=1 Tax=uncultured Bartonella sp. TaxID=104108 RepID=UPI00261E3BC2|nr:MerR family transcriptional regulator [uncultured Bartonella sp.]